MNLERLQSAIDLDPAEVAADEDINRPEKEARNVWELQGNKQNKKNSSQPH